MPELARPIDKNEWNKNQLHPYQLTIFSEIQELDYHFFESSNHHKYLFYLTRFGPFKLARMLFPNVDKASLLEFVVFCKSKGYVFMISLLESVDYLGLCEQGFTQLIDTKNVSIEKSARCNIKKALKEGITVRKIDDIAGWHALNDIHNTLLERKSIRLNPATRLRMYDALFAENNVHCLLYGGFVENKLISGVVVCIAKKYALYTKAATLDDFYSLAPGPLIIKTLSENLNDRVDFVDMNVGVDGVFKEGGEIGRIIRFKKQFGQAHPVFTYMPWWLLLLRKVIRAAKKECVPD